MSELESALLELLEKQSVPVTYSYIDVVLPKWDFSDISKSIETLKQSGLISVGVEGVALAACEENLIESDNIIVEDQHDNATVKYGTSVDYLPYDILIGDSQTARDDQYEQISEEELRGLIASIESGPNILEYSNEKTIGLTYDETEYPDEQLEPKEESGLEKVPLLHAGDSVDTLYVSNRVKNAIRKNGLTTIRELIASLGKILDSRGVGEKSKEELRSLLEVSVSKIGFDISEEQAEALKSISNNARYVFDAFGTLVMLYNPSNKASDRSDSVAIESGSDMLALPIDVLEMGDAINRCFRRNGITTIEALVAKTDEQLLKLRGIGIHKVEVARSALESLYESGNTISIEATKNLSDSEIESQGYDDLLDSFDIRAVGLLDACALRLQEEGIDLFFPSFRVIYLPLAQMALESSDWNASDAKELIFEAISESAPAVEAFKTSFRGRLQSARAEELSSRTECRVRVPGSSIWRKHAIDVLHEFEDCAFDESTGLVKFQRTTLEEWLRGLSERDAELLALRLRGLTLEECGKRAGITRERVRQVITGLLKQRPLLSEDSWRYLYTTYNISKSDFILITGSDAKVSNYLELTTKKKERQSLPLTASLSDERISEEVKSGVRSLLNKDFLFVDGERVHKDRKSIILYLVNKLTERSRITINDLHDAYSRFLEDHSLASSDLPFGKLHNFQEWTRRNVPEILSTRSGEGAYIRFYDASQYDYSKLKELFTSGLFSDIECSAALIYNHPLASEIIQELDIKDEYELHYIAKNYCDLPSTIVFSRMPTIVFGDGDRDKQILELIQENGPIDASSLASMYREKYGVAEGTFKGTYLKGFELYKSHGGYSCSFEEMSSDQLETLSGLLTGDYHPMPLIKMQFKDRYPNASTSLINKLNLEKVGYRPSYELLIRADLDEKKAFEDLIDNHVQFSPETDGFLAEVFKHPAFDSVLQIKVNALDVVEYEKDKFIHLDAVISAIDESATKEDFEDYVAKVLEATDKNEPFTVYSLNKSGFRHRVEGYANEVGFGDEFLESLISTARVGGRIKTTSASGRIVFCKTPFSFSVVDLFESTLSELKRADVEDLCMYLKERYGVAFSASLARSIIRRSELFFHEELDKVFESSEEYDRFVQEVLARQGRKELQ